MSSNENFELARSLRAAEGYLELGMTEDALVEVEAIEKEHRLRLDVVLMRMEILRVMKRWAEGAKLGQEALMMHVNCGALYLVTAYAVRRSIGLTQARDILLSGEHALKKEPMFFFNMGCYQCQLEDVESAKQWLLEAFALDGKYRKVAWDDPDLEALRPWLKAKCAIGGAEAP